MSSNSLCLGIDTSNYTTSVAVCDDDGHVLYDGRRPLVVQKGSKGLRQSDALFQHWQNLPGLVSEALDVVRACGRIGSVVAGSRPRPQDGSYMPVFTAGTAAASMLGAAMDVPAAQISHQEGHIWAAARVAENVDFKRPFIAAHLSGGTLELVLVKDQTFTIVGGTKDISYGQLIDRIGVDMGFDFPAGRAIDELAVSAANEQRNPICKASVQGSYVNLSGVETQLKNAEDNYTRQELSYFLMDRISESFSSMVEHARRETGAEAVLVAGGVACSEFLRQDLSKMGYLFGEKKLCSDNAVGEALSKGRAIWQ